MILDGADGLPRYGLIRRVRLTGNAVVRDQYELLRSETDAEPAEVVVQGEGLPTRQRIVTYLREVASLGGPDAPAARSAMREGWLTVRLPATEPGS